MISQFKNCSLGWASSNALAQSLHLLCKVSNALCTYNIWQQITITMGLPTAENYQQQLQCEKRWH
jgi:hypothetical protein